MTRFAFAAAGTGGHVYPALAVAEELRRAGVDRSDILFLGGERMEAKVVPRAGYEFVGVPLRGLQRSLTVRNLGLPGVVVAAARRFASILRERRVPAMLAMGGYVTVPAGWAAHRTGTKLFLHEQNALPGLANRLAARWAERSFLAFDTGGRSVRGDVIGTPLPRPIVEFDRAGLRSAALARYDLPSGLPVLGVLGGSQGARALNTAVVTMMERRRPPVALVHLTGPALAGEVTPSAAPGPWRVVPFEDEMQYFYGASDLVLCRGGATTVSELLATATPAIVIPRRAADQEANARALTDTGAGLLASADDPDRLGDLVVDLLTGDGSRLAAMAEAGRRAARRDAAERIASVLIEAAA